MKVKNKVKKQDRLSVLKSDLRIQVEGFNQMRTLNTLNNEGVVLRDIFRLSPKALNITISKKDGKKTFAFLDKMGYTYKILGESGAKIIFSRVLARIGLFAGIFIFGALAIILSTMVWRIDIGGNETVDSLFIARELQALGVRRGVFRFTIDTDAVTSALRDMEGVAEGTVTVRGTTVFIQVLEEKDFIPPEMPEEPSDVISSFDAEVTRVITERGTPKVGVGSIVQAGETLIRGEILNTAGEVLEEVKARGIVFGRVAFSQTHIFSETEQYFVRTGETRRLTALSIFGLRLGRRAPAGPMVEWEREVSYGRLGFIRIEQAVYHEVEERQTEIDVDARMRDLAAAAVLDNVIKAGGGEVDVVTTVADLGNGIRMLNIHIVAEVVLGRAS